MTSFFFQNYMVLELNKKIDVLWSFIKSHKRKKILVFMQVTAIPTLQVQAPLNLGSLIKYCTNNFDGYQGFIMFASKHLHCLDQCFPTFFSSRHPYIVLKISSGTPSWFIRYKDKGIVRNGGTPNTSSRHPSVPRHPGWESFP